MIKFNNFKEALNEYKSFGRIMENRKENKRHE